MTWRTPKLPHLRIGALTKFGVFAFIAAKVLMGVQAMAADGLKTVRSNYGPKDTMSRLEAEVKNKGLTVFARVDHAAGAAEVGMPLRPTELLTGRGERCWRAGARLSAVLGRVIAHLARRDPPARQHPAIDRRHSRDIFVASLQRPAEEPPRRLSSGSGTPRRVPHARCVEQCNGGAEPASRSRLPPHGRRPVAAWARAHQHARPLCLLAARSEQPRDRRMLKSHILARCSTQAAR